MTEDFMAQRERLFGIAYRMLGSRSEAEDVLQDAWLRWESADTTEIREPAAWLSTVVTRLALDQLRRAKRQREQYIGPWLPEPLVSDADDAPEATLELADDLSLAFLAVLERLSPEERAAFLLREVFDTDYAEVARILDKAEAACRKLVSRARQRVQAERPRFSVDAATHRGVLQSFLQAMRSGDPEQLMAVLHPQVEMISDGGGQVTAALRVLRGAERLIRLFRAIARRNASERIQWRIHPVNGQPALLQYLNGRLDSVVSIVHDGQRIHRIYSVRNPQKLPQLSEHH